jgi:hypothetical protein
MLVAGVSARPACDRRAADMSEHETDEIDPPAGETAEVGTEVNGAEVSDAPADQTKPRKKRGRGIATVALVVVASVLFAAAVPGMWARNTVLDTDRYVAMVTDIAEEPAVQARLAERITDATFESLDVEDRLQGVLESIAPRLGALAAPITEGVRERIRERVEDLIASPRFQELWADVNRVAHDRIVAVLKGEAENVRLVDGAVTLNTLPMVNQVLASMVELVSSIVGREFTPPEITAETVPSEAISRLEDALGVDLPDDLGAVQVYQADELQTVQDAVNLFDTLAWVLVIAWALAFAGAVAVSRRKRRTLLQLLVVSALLLIVERRFAIAATNSLVEDMDPAAQAAGRAVVDVVLGSWLWATRWLLSVALIAIVVVLVTGPYRWAVWTRRSVAEVATSAVGMVRGTEAGPTARWVAGHRDMMMVVGGAVFAFALLLFDLSMGWFLALVALLALYELAVWRTSAALAAPAPDAAAPG